jgi:hypothetical protein
MYVDVAQFWLPRCAKKIIVSKSKEVKTDESEINLAEFSK